MALRIVAGILIGLWIVLVAMGKGGFVHMLLLNGLGFAATDIVTVYRTRLAR